MDQTYFDWYEFDVKAVLVNQSCNNERFRVVAFQYCCFTYIKNFVSACE